MSTLTHSRTIVSADQSNEFRISADGDPSFDCFESIPSAGGIPAPVGHQLQFTDCVIIDVNWWIERFVNKAINRSPIDFRCSRCSCCYLWEFCCILYGKYFVALNWILSRPHPSPHFAPSHVFFCWLFRFRFSPCFMLGWQFERGGGREVGRWRWTGGLTSPRGFGVGRRRHRGPGVSSDVDVSLVSHFQ